MPHTPTGGARGGTAARDKADREARPAQSIGAVLGALRDEFPEVTVSRIRFLETEGLVRPERTPSGHRRFRAADLDRLRRVLALQRDHCLPLRAIREQLDADDTPREDSPYGDAPPGPPRPAGRHVSARRDRLLAAAGATEAECAEWEEYGLLRADASGHYDVGQLAVARVLAELGRHGLEPRHLRAVKAAADRAACLVDQVVAPLRANRDPRTREHAEATARDLAHLTARLHDAFLVSALEPREGGRR